MVSVVLLPRLSYEHSLQQRMKLSSLKNPQEAYSVEVLHEMFQDSNTFPPTGGNTVKLDTLLELREQAIKTLDDLSRERSSLAGGTDYDIHIGQLLHVFSSDSISEMGVPEVWDFLTLVLLPDVALRRFPLNGTAALARYTGGNRRHVFQRLWKRWRVFGEEMVQQGNLTEDDYQALLERKFILERPSLARAVAEKITSSNLQGDIRRQHTRLFLRLLMQISGLVIIDTQDRDHVRGLLNHMHELAAKNI